METSEQTIHIKPVVLQPPPLKTKNQFRREIKMKHFENVLSIYKQTRAAKQSRRNKFRKYWIYMKLAQGEKITNDDTNEWQKLRQRLKHCSCCELRAQLNETREWLKLKKAVCARVLNFYPGARKLNF